MNQSALKKKKKEKEEKSTGHVPGLFVPLHTIDTELRKRMPGYSIVYCGTYALV